MSRLFKETPDHVFLDVFVECNLRCVQCDIHKLESPPGTLTLDECKSVVDQLADWDSEIRLVLTGGELFLRKERLYALAEYTRERGVYTTMNSNGTLIRPWDVERLPSSGINCIVLSVDSDEAEVHDRIRGVEGTFERVVSAIEQLVDAREQSDEDFTVLTSTIVGAHNLHRVEMMVRFFEGLGVDTTLFQPIQPTFARDKQSDWWQDHDLFPEVGTLVNEAVDTFLRLKRDGARLFQTEQQFEDMRYYFQNPDELKTGQCESQDKHMMVDLFGDVRLCFHSDRLELDPVGNIKDTTLRELWEAEQTEQVRRLMRPCQQECGTMLCHARD